MDEGSAQSPTKIMALGAVSPLLNKQKSKLGGDKSPNATDKMKSMQQPHAPKKLPSDDSKKA